LDVYAVHSRAVAALQQLLQRTLHVRQPMIVGAPLVSRETNMVSSSTHRVACFCQLHAHMWSCKFVNPGIHSVVFGVQQPILAKCISTARFKGNLL
jgi:hypothetical protein